MQIYLYPYAGAAFTYILGGTVSASSEYDDGWDWWKESFEEDVTEFLNPTGFLMLFGMDVLINDKFTVGLEWNRSLTNILKDDNKTNPDKNEWFYNTFIINFGMALNF